MAQEIEIKLALADPEALRARLVALGGAPRERVQEDNRLFDTPGRALRNADVGLRIRTSRPLGAAASNLESGTLTYKGPKCGHVIRQREEIETRIEDAAAAMQILDRLGFRVLVRYEKRRETWQLGSCEVSIDELPGLGWYVEIEGPGAAAIEQMRAALGLQEAAPVADTYAALTAAHGAAIGGGHELCFG